jgi:hypothetical protein
MIVDLKRRVDECLAQLSAAEAATRQMSILAEESAKCMNRLHDACLTPAGLIWAGFESADNLNVAALSRSRDFELAATFDFMASKLPASVLGEIAFSAGGAQVKLTPAAAPRLSQSLGQRFSAYAGSVLLISDWAGTIDGNEVRITAVICAVPSIAGSALVLSVTLGCDVRLCDGNGDDFPLIDVLPIADAKDCQRQVRESVAKSLAGIHESLLPANSAKYLPAGLILSGLRVSDFMLVTGRQYRCGRNFVPLCRSPGPNEQVLLRLHPAHIIDAINRKAVEFSGRVSSFKWATQFSDLWIHVSRSDGFLWVSVDTDVDLRYSLTFSIAPPIALEATLVLVYWHAHWQANNCWPDCDDVLGKAESQTRESIQESSTIVNQVADFSSDWTRGSLQPDPYALLIALRR